MKDALLLERGGILGIQAHPGYQGMFTRNEVLGAFRNGTRVVKVKLEAGDAHAIGTKGTVLGSIMVPRSDLGLGYFIEWDDAPKLAVFTIAWKVAQDAPGSR